MRPLFVTLLCCCAFVSAAAEPARSSLQAHTGHAREVEANDDRVVIAAGWFTFGSSPEEQNAALELCRRSLGTMEKACTIDLFNIEGPQRSVFLPGFAIDRNEVTVAQYRRCMRAGRCDPRPLLDADPRLTQPQLPITRVSWFDAQAYCHYADATLPTELEWERAARGAAARIFPWGDAPRDNASNHGAFVVLDGGGPFARPMVRVDEHDGWALLAPPGSFPSGVSPDGLNDMAGNAMEWVEDVVSDEGPQRATPSAPVTGARRMLRGGSYRQPLLYQRTTAWEAAAPELRSPEVGFRCVNERVVERR